MAGSKDGGIKARNVIYKRYGKDFYKNTGRLGGSVSTEKGFAKNPELARIAGAKGGRISKRGKAKCNG